MLTDNWKQGDASLLLLLLLMMMMVMIMMRRGVMLSLQPEMPIAAGDHQSASVTPPARCRVPWPASRAGVADRRLSCRRPC